MSLIVIIIVLISVSPFVAIVIGKAVQVFKSGGQTTYATPKNGVIHYGANER